MTPKMICVSATIATRVATVMVRLLATEVAVVVTVPRMAAMSLVRRDWISQPRLLVKNCNDWRRRLAKT